MNTAIRAHRILTKIENYQESGAADHWIFDAVEGRLGALIGCYINPGEHGEKLGIFADGLAWCKKEHLVELRFADISQVMLTSGKESESLLLKMLDGGEFLLPIRGRQGRFSDSLQVLRFLDRVMQDKKLTRGNERPGEEKGSD